MTSTLRLPTKKTRCLPLAFTCSCIHLPSSQELKPHLPLLSLPLLSSQHAALSHTSHRNNITTNVMFTPLAHNIASAMKTVLEAEKKKSLEEHQRGEVQEKLQQLRIAEE